MTVITNGDSASEFDETCAANMVAELVTRFPQLSFEAYTKGISASILVKDSYTTAQMYQEFILKALDNMSIAEPEWTFVAAHFHLQMLYAEATRNRGYDPRQHVGSLYNLIQVLTDMGIFNQRLLQDYTEDEITQIEAQILHERDQLFDYIGIKTLSDRYCTHDHDKNLYELPQERWAVIALWIHINEPKDKRMEYVKESYWAASNLYMTSATPTLANSGKSYGQLSSCFIDTIGDSLEGIYNSNTDVARLSKDGGGIGVYAGKIRSKGARIKKFKAKSSGVIPWIKQLNNTAVSVDQLGSRAGAVAIYLDVWHNDILRFLDLKLNNGDDRERAHDIFTGICIPDLFMEKLKEKDETGKSIGEWYTFDPHEVRMTMGYSLEDFYDEKKGDGSFRRRYYECVEAFESGRLELGKKHRAMDIMSRVLRSQFESGTPYMFNRDTINRENPNKHAGMIYCSNLCTEIAQNMSPTDLVSEWVEEEDGNQYIITKRKAGDFVVCNLNSVSLQPALRDQVMERLIKIQVRMLDNVIDLNTIAVLQAGVTNKKYRAIGLGSSGWHHELVSQRIRWESQEAVDHCEEVYSDFAYLGIKASMELAKEKGHYPMFPGSEWHTGEYFVRRKYVWRDENGTIRPIPGMERWYDLCLDVMTHGLRNGWIFAVAPNASTSLIARSSASIDPVYQKFYAEEKANFKIPITAPDLNEDNQWFYKEANTIDQHWSIRQNAVRQRHIDQAISFNLYITPDTKAKELLAMHLDVWESGIKTSYYTRSRSLQVEDCTACSS